MGTRSPEVGRTRCPLPPPPPVLSPKSTIRVLLTAEQGAGNRRNQRTLWRRPWRSRGIGVIEEDRDSRRIHRLSRCHAPSRGNFDLAGSDSGRKGSGVLARARQCRDGGTEEAALPESVDRVTEVIGVSDESWEAAARSAVQTAANTVRDLRVAEVVRQDVVIENGQGSGFRVGRGVSLKSESGA